MPKHPNQRTYPLRLSPDLRAQIEALAREDHISVTHFISIALAEKLSRIEHEEWLKRNPAASGRTVTRL